MKTVTGKKLSSKRVPVAGALTFLSEFVNTETGASQAMGAYLQRATASFDELLRADARTRRWRDREGGVEAETKTEEVGGWEMRLKRKSGSEEEMEVGTEERKQRKKKKKRRNDGEDDH